MHIEFLIEDLSGERILQTLIPRILKDHVTYNIHKYKGIGHIPKKLSTASEIKSKMLLNNLPSILSGFGRTFQSYGKDYSAVVFVIMDLDKNDFSTFRNQLLTVLNSCNLQPTTYFCIAVEEGEAWLFGDLNAIREAYPHAKTVLLESYVNDSICGTWEKLAEAIYPKGLAELKSQGRHVIGTVKCEWAEKIAPFMDLDNNKSPSFNYFYKKLRGVI